VGASSGGSFGPWGHPGALCRGLGKKIRPRAGQELAQATDLEAGPFRDLTLGVLLKNWAVVIGQPDWGTVKAGGHPAAFHREPKKPNPRPEQPRFDGPPLPNFQPRASKDFLRNSLPLAGPSMAAQSQRTGPQKRSQLSWKVSPVHGKAGV